MELSLKVPVVLSCWVAPSAIEGDPGVMSILVSGARTVKPVCALALFRLALIVVVPGVVPTTWPPLIGATMGALESQ